ncbi:hypothetical protein VNO78_32799 [Psophocarpus tetragonolobus]|uniref:Uncharacterized protein n=1 Tax=Psophocarpus tetragonolobus TaxID=3891 RepID=A0AAN9NW54_PSOTE
MNQTLKRTRRTRKNAYRARKSERAKGWAIFQYLLLENVEQFCEIPEGFILMGQRISLVEGTSFAKVPVFVSPGQKWPQIYCVLGSLATIVAPTQAGDIQDDTMRFSCG